VTTPITAEALLERYNAFLLDAYGVLVHTAGALPGARRFLGAIRDAGKPLLVVSNDASRMASRAVERYRGFGLELREEEVVTAGMLIGSFFERAGLRGSKAVVLGPEDSRAMARMAGGKVVAADDEEAEVIIVADDEGYPFLETIEATLTTLIKRRDRGLETHLILPNPDLIYPKSAAGYGLTAGSVALLLEAGLGVRYGAGAPRFTPLGKPSTEIFERALRQIGFSDRRREVVMLGDQLGTDVAGAQSANIDAVLLSTGLTRTPLEQNPSKGDRTAGTPHCQPTWTMGDLSLAAH